MAEQWAQLLFETAEKGISSAVTPELLPDNQLAWGGNISIRGGKPYTRPPWVLRADLPRGLIQGGEYFGIQGGMLVAAIAGRLYRIRINNRRFEVSQIQLGFENSAVLKQVWMCQTVETLVIQDGQSNAILYNGSLAVRATGNYVPRGKMMAYGNGRLWMAINDKELIAGNIRTRAAGSELVFTETNYLTGGGSLYFPRGITGLSFIPVTGQADYGALLAYGLDYSKAIRADITQRDQWASTPGFEQSILNSVGAASQWSIVSVNQDLYWRDSNGGIRSIRNALADEQGPGSSPVSREVSRLTDFDSQQLMRWCSGVYHDNRLLMTSSPFLMPNGGIGWKDVIALDFAPLSTLQGKSQASYDGQWTGLNIVKFLGGDFRNKNRAFALTTDDDGNNQLWETGGQEIADMTGLCENRFAILSSPIKSWIEYPRRNMGVSKNRKRLERCDVWLSNVDGALDLQVFWRADNSQKWLQWDEAATCAKTTDASTETPHVWKNLLSQERPQFKTFTIPQNINELVGYAAEVGFEFQIRLVWTGFARIHRMMTYGSILEDPPYAMREEFQAVCIENDVSGNQVVYSIQTNACQQIRVTQEQTSIVDTGAFNFGTAGVDGRTLTFAIHNDGALPLTVEDIQLTDGTGVGFTIVDQPDHEIAPGGLTTFILHMIGGDNGSRVNHVLIPNNSIDHPDFEFLIQGNIDIQNATVEYRSKSSNYTLCGYSELTDPSTPPRKYLRSTAGGGSFFQGYTDGTCEVLSAVNFHCTFSGVCTIDPNTCAEEGAMTVNCGTPTNVGCVDAPNAPSAGTTTVNTPTSSVNTSNGMCFDSGSSEIGFGKYVSNNVSLFLSDEDTEANAIARANNAIPYDGSPATVAKVFPRVSGFSAAYVSVDGQYTFDDLPGGIPYTLKVTYGRRVYGSMGPFVEYAEELIYFTSVEGANVVPFHSVPNESGFETNVLFCVGYPT